MSGYITPIVSDTIHIIVETNCYASIVTMRLGKSRFAVTLFAPFRRWLSETAVILETTDLMWHYKEDCPSVYTETATIQQN